MFRLKIIFVSLLVMFVLPAGAPAGAADEPAGFVAALRGRVTIVNPAGEERRLRIKDKFYPDDTIKTGKRGRIQLVFRDNTIISLGRASVLKVAEYQWDSNQHTGAITTNISGGFFRVLGGAIAKTSPEKFKTTTPSATIGIRGSMYGGQVRGNQLTVVFLGGTGIEVRNQAGTVVITEPGFGTRVSSRDTPPEEPSRLSIPELTENQDDGEGGDDAPESGTSAEEEQDQDSGGEAGDSATGDDTGFSSDGADESVTGGGLDNTGNDPGGDVQGLAAEAVADSSQDTIQEETGEAITGNPSPAMSGSYLGVLLDPADQAGARIWRGNTSGQSYTLSPATASVRGQVSASALSVYGSTAGRSFSWTNAAAPYAPSLAYNGDIELNNQLREVADLVSAGQTETFNTLEVHYGQPGEFNATMLLAKSFDGSHSFFEVKSLGITAPAASPYEIMGYSGGGFGAYIDYSVSPTAMDAFVLENYFMEANFHNHNVVGYIWNDHAPADLSEEIIKIYFIGSVSGSTIDNIKFFGHGGAGDSPGIIAWNGSAAGKIYGSSYQGIALSGSGNFFDMQSSQTAKTADFYLGLGGMIDDDYVYSQEPAPTGSLAFTGFVTGISEDMADPATDRRLFFSKTPALSFTLNQDTGALSGYLSAEDLLDVANDLTNIRIGGPFASASTLEDMFVAELGCSSGSCVKTSAATGGLKNYGNYLATAELTPENEISEHVSWGYWEISYDDPASGSSYHLHVPGSLWVAGQQTPTSEIQGLIDAKFTGTYSGGARGVHIDSSSQVNELPNGSADLTIDFSAANPVSGSINFPGVVNLAVDSATSSLNTSGFAASFQGSGGSGLHGAFYGPDGAAVGGNFDAVQGSDRYLGIFLGNR